MGCMMSCLWICCACPFVWCVLGLVSSTSLCYVNAIIRESKEACPTVSPEWSVSQKLLTIWKWKQLYNTFCRVHPSIVLCHICWAFFTKFVLFQMLAVKFSSEKASNMQNITLSIVFNADKLSWIDPRRSPCSHNLELVQLICEERPGHLQGFTCLTCTSLWFPLSRVSRTWDNTRPLWLLSQLSLQPLLGQKSTWKWCLCGLGVTRWRCFYTLSGTHRLNNTFCYEALNYRSRVLTTTVLHAIWVIHSYHYSIYLHVTERRWWINYRPRLF